MHFHAFPLLLPVSIAVLVVAFAFSQLALSSTYLSSCVESCSPHLWTSCFNFVFGPKQFLQVFYSPISFVLFLSLSLFHAHNTWQRCRLQSIFASVSKAKSLASLQFDDNSSAEAACPPLSLYVSATACGCHTTAFNCLQLVCLHRKTENCHRTRDALRLPKCFYFWGLSKSA